MGALRDVCASCALRARDMGGEICASKCVLTARANDRKIGGPTRRSAKGGWTPEEVRF